jgi:hypothetical protein
VGMPRTQELARMVPGTPRSAPGLVPRSRGGRAPGLDTLGLRQGRRIMATQTTTPLQAAKQVAAVVKSELTAGNKWYSAFTGGFTCTLRARKENLAEIAARREEIRKKAAAAGRGQAAEWSEWQQIIAIWAKYAALHHCGNCAEHAAIAFILLRNRGVRPLEYMFYAAEDHAFVVIGRKADTDLGRPASWGSSAVVCDAYYGKAYPVSRIEAEMGSMAKHAPKLVCRLA